MENSAHDIFTSYADVDRKRAEAIAEAIEKEGFSIWRDPWIIGSRGKAIDEKEIKKALEEAKCVLVLWSRESVSSREVNAEAAEGKRREIIVPAKIDLVDPPPDFTDIQTIDLTDWDPKTPHSGFNKLLKSISRMIESSSADEKENRKTKSDEYKSKSLQEAKLGDEENQRSEAEDNISEGTEQERQYWIVVATEKKFDWIQAFQKAEHQKKIRPIHWTEAGGELNQSRLRRARANDLVLAYQSSANARQIVGIAHVASAPYPHENHYAVDIAPDLLLDKPVHLDELKAAVPETEKVRISRLGFAAVKPYEWSVIRELIRYHNPNMDPSELPQSPIPHSPELIIFGDKESTHVDDEASANIGLKNRGNTTWDIGTAITIRCQGERAKSAGLKARYPYALEFPLTLEKKVPPGAVEFVTVPLENIEIGSYNLEWQATLKSGTGVIESNSFPQKISVGETAVTAGDDRTDRLRDAQNEKESKSKRKSSRATFEKAMLKYQPPPVDNTLSVEIYPTTVKLTFQRKEYTGPNRISSGALIDAGIDVRYYGELLFSGIIHSGLSGGGVPDRTTRDGYAVARNLASEGQLRFELRLDPNDLDLHRHRWEYIKHPDDDKPLALQSGFPFYRYQTGRSGALTVSARPLKILVAICNPKTLKEKGHSTLEKLEKLQVDRERKIIEMGLKRLRDKQVAEYRILDRENGKEPPTLKRIHDTLQEGYHVLHLLCHGVFIESPQQAGFYLVMEREDGKHHFVSANDFKMLASETMLRLVVLVSCVSALSPQKDALRGLGPSLVRAGVPAVIAMQDYLPIKTAQRFTQYFYDDLARSGQVDMAMAATRLSIHRDDLAERNESGTWGIPALFMSTSEGKLFDVDAQKAHEKLRKLDTAEVTPDAALADADELAAPQSMIGLETAAPMASPSYILSALSQPLQVAAASGMVPQTLKTEDRSEIMAQPQPRMVMSDDLDLNANIIAEGADSLRQFVSGEGGDSNSPKLKLPRTMYAQVASALNVGKHVVLIGPPGTGKTSLAKAICDYAGTRKLNRGTTYTTATADWTTFDTVGGYVPTADQTLQFRPGSFLQAICHGQWLVIDEINRAEIDKAFGELFTVLSGQQVDLPYRVAKHQVRVLAPDRAGDDGWTPPEAVRRYYDYVVHPNWRIVATMNVYDKSSLFNMSLAFMRRFAFVDVDLPDEETLYRTLRNDWVQEHASLTQVTANQDVNTLKTNLNALLDPKTHLMSRRALGPAIVKDMIAYAGDRYSTKTANENMIDLLAEAFLLFAVPQLDGLDREGIIEIYQELKQRFDPVAETKGILPRIRALYPYIPRPEWERQESQGGGGAGGGS